MDKIRKKKPNFSAKETNTLISLVQEHLAGVTSTRIDMKNEIRQESWQQIAKAFNTKHDYFRSPKELKNRYKNIKAKSMKTFANYRCHANGCGWPQPKTVIKIEDDEINETIKTEENNQYQGDTFASYYFDEFNVTVDDMTIDCKPLPPTEDRIENPNPNELMKNATYPSHTNYHDSIDSQSIAVQCDQTDLSDKTAEIATRKTRKRPDVPRTASNVQRKLYEEHKVKMENLRKKHDREMDLMEKESARRIELMEEESKQRRLLLIKQHNLKCEILELQKKRFM